MKSPEVRLIFNVMLSYRMRRFERRCRAVR